MQVLLINSRHLSTLFMFSIAVVLLSFLAVSSKENQDIENADMSVLAGHSIVIDPGHGGVDNGASGNQVIEKEVTLAISTKLGQILEQYGARVIFTREGDIDYYTRGKGGKRNDLLKRIEIIENSGAELFISIHCNAFRNVKLSGAQVFYNPQFAENKIIAERLQGAIRGLLPNNKRLAKSDTSILLLKGSKIPGVMIETGYLTNQQEAKLLIDSTYQEKLVEHIAKGLAYHFSLTVAN